MTWRKKEMVTKAAEVVLSMGYEEMVASGHSQKDPRILFNQKACPPIWLCDRSRFLKHAMAASWSQA